MQEQGRGRGSGDRRPAPDEGAAEGEPQRDLDQRFWDAVQREIETMDWADFAQFLSADALPYEPRPSFDVQLRQRLRALLDRLRH
jgi:hypothetical protein